MDGSCQVDHLTPPSCTVNGTDTFPVHDPSASFGHRIETPPQCPQSVVISNFVAVAGTLTGTFDVVPSTATCTASGPVTVSRSISSAPQVTVSVSGASRDVAVVPSSHAEQVTVTVTCSTTNHSSTASAVFIPPVRISGFGGASRAGPGEITDDFRVTPYGASCSVSHSSGVAASVSLSDNSGELREVSVNTTTTGSVSVRLTCTDGGVSTTTDPQDFSATPRVVVVPPVVARPPVKITDFDGVTGPSPLVRKFTVEPFSALCFAVKESGSDDVTLSWLDNWGFSRTLSVTTSTPGTVTVLMICLNGLRVDIVAADFIVKPTVRCERDLELVANPDFTLEPEFVFYDGWLPVPSTDTCLSTQLGNAQTRHYANKFRFRTNSDVTITVFADPDTSRDPRLKLTVIKKRSGPPTTGDPSDTVITAASGDTYELTPGTYTIEVTTVEALATGHFTLSAAALGGTGFNTVTATSVPPGQKVYPVAAGALEGIMKAAQNALDTDVHNCAANVPARYQLTRNRLVALLLAASTNELVGDGPHALMNVGRSDWVGLSQRHKPLYSFNTTADNVRAFWHAGVGLWQIDDANGSGLNHAERAHSMTGAARAAYIFLEEYCTGTQSDTNQQRIQKLKSSFEPWHDCSRRQPDLPVVVGIECYNTFEDIVVGDAFPPSRLSSDVRLYLRVEDDYADRAGGVRPRKCVWSTEGAAFDCFLYDMKNAQGEWWNGSLDGDTASGGISPVACPFISFTQEWPGASSSQPLPSGSIILTNGMDLYKFVVFKDVDHECVFSGGSVPSGSDIIAAVPKGHNLRNIVGVTRTDKWWYVDTVGGVGVEVCDDCKLTDDDED